MDACKIVNQILSKLKGVMWWDLIAMPCSYPGENWKKMKSVLSEISVILAVSDFCREIETFNNEGAAPVRMLAAH